MNCNFANDILLYKNQLIQILVEFEAIIVKFSTFSKITLAHPNFCFINEFLLVVYEAYSVLIFIILFHHLVYNSPRKKTHFPANFRSTVYSPKLRKRTKWDHSAPHFLGKTLLSTRKYLMAI